MNETEENDRAPEMHTERITIEGDRYLIYYTFSQIAEPADNQTIDPS